MLAALSKEEQAGLGLGKEPRGTAAFIQAGYTLFDNAGEVARWPTLATTPTGSPPNARRLKPTIRPIRRRKWRKVRRSKPRRIKTRPSPQMNDWVAQYLKIAKVALRGKKQLLEKIGVLARTSKTAAQKAAPQKAAATRAAKKA